MDEQRVNYDDIRESCDKLTNYAKSLKECKDNINTEISKLKSSWKGTAADKFTETIKPFAEKAGNASRVLAESVLFLASCADGYESIGEQSVNELRDIIGENYIKDFDVENAQEYDLTKPTYKIITEKEQETGAPLNGQGSPNDFRITPNNNGPSNGGSSVGNSGSGRSITPIAPINPIKLATNKTDGTADNKTLDGEDKTILKNGESVEIPNTLNQDQHQSVQYNNNQFDENSKEKEIEDIWKAQGSSDHNGIATISVSDENRYLVKVSQKYGNVGDSVDITLEDGTVVKGIIAENQPTNNNTTTYGTSQENDKVSIVQFEAASEESVKYEWNSSNEVRKITNNGNVLTNTSVKTEVVEGKTYPPSTVSVETNNSTQSFTPENTTTDNTIADYTTTEDITTDSVSAENATPESNEG